MCNFVTDPNDDYSSGSDVEAVTGVLLDPQQEQQHTDSATEESENATQDAAADTTQNMDQEEEEGNWHFTDDSDEEERGATMEEVFEVEPALERTRDQPPDILVGAEVIDVKFHPSTQLIAAATLDSEVVSYRYSTEQAEEVGSSEHHTAALRSIQFSKDGSSLYTASKDCTVAVLDAATWAVKHHYTAAHTSPVYSLCAINSHLFASGDDDGLLKVWDDRTRKCVFEFRCGEETVNAIIVDEAEKTLVAAVNDGSIAAFSLGRRKLIVQSEMYDYPLTSMAIVRHGSRLAVGSENGNLIIFKWGEFGYHIDCVTEQPQQINCMLAVGDNRLITGCEDTYIRALNVYPHRYVGVVGRHGGYGVEALSVSCDQQYLASCCCEDDTVKFWDLQHVYSKHTDGKFKGCKIRDLKNNLLSSRERNPVDFFSDLPKDIASDDDDAEYAGPVSKPSNKE